jgi:hypothetical protein
MTFGIFLRLVSDIVQQDTQMELIHRANAFDASRGGNAILYLLGCTVLFRVPECYSRCAAILAKLNDARDDMTFCFSCINCATQLEQNTVAFFIGDFSARFLVDEYRLSCSCQELDLKQPFIIVKNFVH